MAMPDEWRSFDGTIDGASPDRARLRHEPGKDILSKSGFSVWHGLPARVRKFHGQDARATTRRACPGLKTFFPNGLVTRQRRFVDAEIGWYRSIRTLAARHGPGALVLARAELTTCGYRARRDTVWATPSWRGAAAEIIQDPPKMAYYGATALRRLMLCHKKSEKWRCMAPYPQPPWTYIALVTFSAISELRTHRDRNVRLFRSLGLDGICRLGEPWRL
jgi:hypothetical protein